jgi:hypothetical protein
MQAHTHDGQRHSRDEQAGHKGAADRTSQMRTSAASEARRARARHSAGAANPASCCHDDQRRTIDEANHLRLQAMLQTDASADRVKNRRPLMAG